MAFSKDELKKASELAMKGFKMPDGTTIIAMRYANRNDKEFKPLADKKKPDLQKPIKKKGGMK